MLIHFNFQNIYFVLCISYTVKNKWSLSYHSKISHKGLCCWMILLKGLSVSFFNFLLTLKDMSGILKRISTAFNLVAKLFGELIYMLETFSSAALKTNINLCIISEAVETSFLYNLLTQTSVMSSYPWINIYSLYFLPASETLLEKFQFECILFAMCNKCFQL